MAVPDYQSFMLPLLNFAADGREHNQTEAKDAHYHHFNITESDRREMLPSWRISYQICLNPIKGSPRCIQATPALRGPRALPRGGPEARLASPTKKIVCVDLN